MSEGKNEPDVEQQKNTKTEVKIKNVIAEIFEDENRTKGIKFNNIFIYKSQYDKFNGIPKNSDGEKETLMDILIVLKIGLISTDTQNYNLENCLGKLNDKNLEISLQHNDANLITFIDNLIQFNKSGKTPKCDITITFDSTSPPNILDKMNTLLDNLKKPFKLRSMNPSVIKSEPSNVDDYDDVDDYDELRIGGMRSKKGGKKTTKKSKKSKKGGKSRKNKISGSKKHF